MDYFAVIQAAIKYGPLIKEIIDEARTNDTIVAKIKALSEPFATLLEAAGKLFFPKASPQLSIAAAVMATFDPSVTKWLQGSLNELVVPPPALVVDGIYGPHTRAAVEALQVQLGLTVDGWAGRITQAAIEATLGGKK